MIFGGILNNIIENRSKSGEIMELFFFKRFRLNSFLFLTYPCNYLYPKGCPNIRVEWKTEQSNINIIQE